MKYIYFFRYLGNLQHRKNYSKVGKNSGLNWTQGIWVLIVCRKEVYANQTFLTQEDFRERQYLGTCVKKRHNPEIKSKRDILWKNI